MHTKAITLTEIQKELAMLPDERLMEVKDFVDFILHKSIYKKKTVKLKGIWASRGFEAVADLDYELKIIREKAVEAVIRKKL